MRIPLICAALVASGLAFASPATAADEVSFAGKNNSKGCYVPEMVAHRFGGGEPGDPYYYENSKVALDKAVALKVPVIETDVRWSKDNVAYIIHDRELENHTVSGTGMVDERDSSYIDTLELKRGGGKILKFSEVLKVAKDNNMTIFPEYKPEDAISKQVWLDDYAQQIKDSGVKAVIPSFSPSALAEFKKLLPGYKQIWFNDIVKNGKATPANVPAGAYAGLINVEIRGTDIIKQMTSAGIETFAWYNKLTKGDEPEGWAEMAELKPVAIITDYPAEYNEWAANTTYCLKQTVKCVAVPKKMKGNAKVVLLKRTCKTSQGVKVAVKVTGKGKGKLTKNAKGKVVLKTKAKGKVKVTYSAKGKGDYPAWSKSKSYKLK